MKEDLDMKGNQITKVSVVFTCGWVRVHFSFKGTSNIEIDTSLEW